MTVSNVMNELNSMQNQTTWSKANSNVSTQQTTSDKDMFLSLMLQQMQNQDPTQPMDNNEWLAQLAQFSSLEQMTAVNEGLAELTGTMQALAAGIAQNGNITQTLSLIGKEVDIVPDPEKPDEVITGTVTEATFEDGEGKIKVNGKYYSIAYVQNIREAGSSSGETPVTPIIPPETDENKQ